MDVDQQEQTNFEELEQQLEIVGRVQVRDQSLQSQKPEQLQNFQQFKF